MDNSSEYKFGAVPVALAPQGIAPPARPLIEDDDDGPTLLDDIDENSADDELLGPSEEEDDLDLDIDDSKDLDDDNADRLDIGAVDVDEEADPNRSSALDELPFDEGGDAPPVFADDEGHVGDETGPLDGHDNFGDNMLPATQDDGGAEGLSDGSESFLDEANLPAIDADAEGDFELTDLLAEMGFGSDEAWEIVQGFASDLSLTDVSAHGGLVVAAGTAAIVLGRGEQALRVRQLDEAATACVASEDRVYLGTRRGIELLSVGEGGSVLCERANISELVVAALQLFALADGSLLRVDLASGATHVLRTDVSSIGAAQGTLFITTTSGTLERLRGHDGDFEPIKLDSATRSAVEQGATIAACTSKALLLIGEGGVVRVSEAGRARVLDVESVVAAAACGAEEFLLLSADSATFSVSTVAKTGDVNHVARVTTSQADAPTAIAWDQTRELAFVAGPGGLFALRPRLEH